MSTSKNSTKSIFFFWVLCIFSSAGYCASVIYNNTSSSGSWFPPLPNGYSEVLDYGTSSGGYVTRIEIGYVTELSNPGTITVRFYRYTDYYTSPGSHLKTFSLSGLSGSPGGAYMFTHSYDIASEDVFYLPSGDFGYSYEFTNSNTGIILCSGGSGNENWIWGYDDFWYDWYRTWFGGSPWAGSYMKIYAESNPPGGEINGYKFNDVDGDGVWDGGEEAMPGWEMYLDLDNDGVFDVGEPNSITNDPNGMYKFTELAPGTYTVAEVNRSGWSQTYPSGAGTHSVTIAGNEVFENKNFGNVLVQSGSINGTKYHDVNGNGVRDGGEAGLAGWTIYLDLNENGEFDGGEPSTTTNSSGNYTIPNVWPGTYTVGEVAQCGWKQTAPLFGGDETLIGVSNPRDLVFDLPRNILYISTSSGNVERYDLAGKTLLSALSVGTSLYGMDISVDHNWLYVADEQTSGGQGYLRKVDLNSGTVTNISYTLTSNESGSRDIAIGSDGKGLMTTRFNGSGSTPLRELDTVTDVLTIRNDVPGTGPSGEISMDSSIHRSADRTLLFVTGTSSGGHVYKYDAVSDQFPDDIELGASLFNRPFAVDNDGSLVGFQIWLEPVRIWSSNFFPVMTLGGGKGGLVFDPKRNIVYVADSDVDEIAAYSSKSGVELGRVSIAENLGVFTSFYEGMMAVSEDGRFLCISTDSGVRLYSVGGVHIVSVGNGDVVNNVDFGNVGYMAGDFDEDEEAGPPDLDILLQAWLGYDLCIDIAPAGGDGTVNGKEFSSLSGNWLKGVVIEENEGFETGSFSKYPWSHSGDASWTIVSDESYEGSYCARSGDISHNQTSILEVTLNVEAGPVRFNYKRSSETGRDKLIFYVDGVMMVSGWSGDIDWKQYTEFVSAGVHTFKWEYLKDGSVSDYSDRSWIDGIRFPPIN